MCKFGSQICQAFTPQRRFPQVGPWHHVGVTMEITLDKNGSLYDPAGTESWNMQNRNETSKRIRWSRYVELIRLHILVNCMELRWRQPCSDPVAPCTRFRKGEDRRKKKREVLHLFRCYTHTHTHTRQEWIIIWSGRNWILKHAE